MPVIETGKPAVNLNANHLAQAYPAQALSSQSSNPAEAFQTQRRFTRIMKMPDQGVSIITCTHRTAYFDRVFDNYLRQEYPHKELIIVLNNDSMSAGEWEQRASRYQGIRVFRLPEGTSLGACYNFAIEQSRFNYLAKFDDDDYYAPQYLMSSMLAFKQYEGDIIGKSARFVYFESISTLACMASNLEFTLVPYVVGATLVFKKSVWFDVRFRNITHGEDTEFQNDSLEKGYRIFSIDRFNYVTIRHPNTVEHTFVIDDLAYLALGEFVAQTEDFTPYITRNQAYFL